ncbi:hypothetical protein V6N00_12640 [Tersicoccus sp. MR15.9]|uniref:hypothetical protein n=1 Tax=Tersicoccus mangrovi TaxID=3121635 RepID=UPI002FE64295
MSRFLAGQYSLVGICRRAILEPGTILTRTVVGAWIGVAVIALSALGCLAITTLAALVLRNPAMIILGLVASITSALMALIDTRPRSVRFPDEDRS